MMASELNDLQRVDLDILAAVTALCERRGLRYYALGGTLLGAVRHKGFIPWDDDIDIAMPRPDYDQLLSIAEEELGDRYVLQNYRTHPDDPAPTYLTRVGRAGTLVSYGVAQEAKLMPIWIDVFPLDAMPTHGALRMIHKYRLLWQRLKFQFSCYEANAHQHKTNRPAHERALMRFRELTKFGAEWDPAQVLAETERVARAYDYGDEEWFVNLFGAYKFREMFPKSWFGEGVELPFEDTVIRCPIEYDRVLTQMYGNYMTPPPRSDRALHHCVTVLRLPDDLSADVPCSRVEMSSDGDAGQAPGNRAGRV